MTLLEEIKKNAEVNNTIIEKIKSYCKKAGKENTGNNEGITTAVDDILAYAKDHNSQKALMKIKEYIKKNTKKDSYYLDDEGKNVLHNVLDIIE
jgi:outer membrane protein assembly factor BamD (BamD/ComL family)